MKTKRTGTILCLIGNILNVIGFIILVFYFDTIGNETSVNTEMIVDSLILIINSLIMIALSILFLKGKIILKKIYRNLCRTNHISWNFYNSFSLLTDKKIIIFSNNLKNSRQ